MTKVALTIAASDSSSGAGVQADIAAMRRLGVYGVCAITAVTAQNSCGVHKTNSVPPTVVAAQIDASTQDYEIGAVKIGMLHSPQVVSRVAERIKRRRLGNIVIDPVLRAKNGEVMLSGDGPVRLKKLLLPLCLLVTPNSEEAEEISGIKVTDMSSAREAAKVIYDMGAQNVLVKGGHFSEEPIDVLYDGTSYTEFAGPRQQKRMHGTGCVLSAAIVAGLASGLDLNTSIGKAKEHISEAIARSIPLGKGGMDYYF